MNESPKLYYYFILSDDYLSCETQSEQQQCTLTNICFQYFSILPPDGAGGWNGDGCNVSKESSSNKTVCHCDHLTHFGILMVRVTQQIQLRIKSLQNDQLYDCNYQYTDNIFI